MVMVETGIGQLHRQQETRMRRILFFWATAEAETTAEKTAASEMAAPETAAVTMTAVEATATIRKWQEALEIKPELKQQQQQRIKIRGGSHHKTAVPTSKQQHPRTA